MGIGSFPLQIATKFNIPLLVYGESIRESHGRASYSDGNSDLTYDRDYFVKVSARKQPKEILDKNITAKILAKSGAVKPKVDTSANGVILKE